MLGNMRFRANLLIIGICCLPVALIAVLFTLSRNTCIWTWIGSCKV